MNKLKDEILTSLEKEIIHDLINNFKKKVKKKFLKTKLLKKTENDKALISELEKNLKKMLFQELDVNINSENKKSIRDFLYIDIPSFESLVAQINDGHIVTQIVDESKTHTEDYIGKIIKLMLDGRFGLPEIGGEITLPSYNKSDVEFERKLIVLRQADNIFNILRNYLSNNNMLNKEAVHNKVGSYVEINNVFNYVDLNRYEMLTNDDLIEKYNESDGISKEIINELKKIKSEIPSLKKLIPYNTFLYTDDIIILINENCLRDNKERIGFKFNNKVTVFGKISKSVKLSSANNTNATDYLNVIQRQTLLTLKRLGFIKKEEVCFITPMAIYYEMDTHINKEMVNE